MKQSLISSATFWALAAAAALQPATAAAQATSFDVGGPWRYRTSLYLYLPSLSGSSNVPADGTSINVSADRILDNFEGLFMASFETHNGRWGVFTDLMYLNFGNSRQGSRDFSIGGVLPVGTSANLGWDLEGAVWTLAGQYRVHSDPALAVDLLGGARMFNLKQSLRWDIAGTLGSLPPASRSGSSEIDDTLWDGVVGVKGRYTFGSGSRWTAPFYLDVGAGNSKLTWQAAAGVGYAFSWGEVSAMWRYLSYEMKSGSGVQDLSFSGPMLGATFVF